MGRPQVFNEDFVIDKALDIFWEKGYSAASTKDLINGTGISNGSFFNSFGDKGNLYFKCLQKYNVIHITALETLLTANLPIKEKLKQLFLEATKKQPGKETYRGCFFFNTSIDNGVDNADTLTLVQYIDKRIESAFLTAVEMAKENNEITTNVTSIALAQYLFNVLNGLRVLLLNPAPQTTINNVINVTLELFPSSF